MIHSCNETSWCFTGKPRASGDDPFKKHILGLSDK